MRVKFRENSVYNWTPKTKINMIHCREDEIILYTISTKKHTIL